MKLEQVFGISPALMETYVKRKADDEFKRHLQARKHVVIFGSSKQGKTSLRKKHLSHSECVTISCQSRWDLRRLYVSILKEAGFEPKLSEEKIFRIVEKLVLA